MVFPTPTSETAIFWNCWKEDTEWKNQRHAQRSCEYNQYAWWQGLLKIRVVIILLKKTKRSKRNRLISHFTVLFLLIRSLSRSEAQDDFVMIQTFPLPKCHLHSVIMLTSFWTLSIIISHWASSRRKLSSIMLQFDCRPNRLFTKSYFTLFL